MEDTVTIVISEFIYHNLGMNSSARKLFEEINNSPAKCFIIDFSNVIFMSRTFAQEYLTQKHFTDKEVIEENIPEDVRKMFEVVSKDFERFQ